MTRFVPENLNLKTMVSGHLCLELSEAVGWDQFPRVAKEITAMIGVTAPDKAEGVEMHIWRFQLPTCQLKLVFDDFPTMVSLESDSLQGDDILRDVSEQLKKKYENLR
jgi:hypothetical protein